MNFQELENQAKLIADFKHFDLLLAIIDSLNENEILKRKIKRLDFKIKQCNYALKSGSYRRDKLNFYKKQINKTYLKLKERQYYV